MNSSGLNGRRLKATVAIGVGLFFGLIGSVYAACNSTTSETGAAFVLEDSGQGNLSCGDFIGTSPADGVPGSAMTEITLLTVFGAGDKSVDWDVSNPNEEADMVIVEAADGKRCLYSYPDNAKSGDNLTPNGNKKIKDIVACTDGVLSAELPEPPPQPIATGINGCANTIASDFQTAVDGTGEFNTSVSFGQDDLGDQTLAVCSDTSQVLCVDQCVRPDNWPANTEGLECEPDPVTGELPLSCRPCELASVEPPIRPNSEDAQYCWELSHAVCDDDPLFPDETYCVDRTASESFIFPGPTERGYATWEHYDGSSCYLVSVNFGGIQYDFWTPTGCPGGVDVN